MLGHVKWSFRQFITSLKIVAAFLNFKLKLIRNYQSTLTEAMEYTSFLSLTRALSQVYGPTGSIDIFQKLVFPKKILQMLH